MPTETIKLPLREEPDTVRTTVPEAHPYQPPEAHPQSTAVPVLSPLEQENQRLQTALAAAEAELEQYRQQVYEQQFNEGYEAGFQQSSELIEEIATLERSFLEQWQQTQQQFETEVAKIVLAAVGKILGNALARPEACLAAVKEVMQSVGPQDKLTIHVSTHDHPLFERYKRQLNATSQVEYVPDERVQIGGCLIELKRGMLDGRIEVQLQSLVDTLSSVRRS
ncbi:FliH/SctL family protein [Gynuella sunshinyii]|uniref:Flagellar assembly protein FliH n=1 Tax=Gynuella sunshinyii YC6258 TaxID=1445510 RepID=A0A0C5VR52_9GAMM|nr:FliH/SctL family protein [Gynuella sunshinyii]AJQ92714.1 flagellar biosynthesis/type III secretory pathway protein [Gynuella sunshinyii YC6258]